MAEPERTLPLSTRIWFAWMCFFRVLFDGAFAQRAFEAQTTPQLPAARAPDAPEPRSSKRPPRAVEPQGTAPALQLLALLQREGRFVDFLEQDIGAFNDGEIGAVARVVHEGCRKALHEHAELSPVRAEEEGTPVTLQEGFNPAEVKLSGNLSGSAPYKGVLRHRGWRASQVKLPAAVNGHDATVIAPAEIEL